MSSGLQSPCFHLCMSSLRRFITARSCAQIVDAVTLQPVAGVQIQAEWPIWRRTLNLESQWRRLNQVSAVSDASGFFEIPAWGPVLAPRWYFLSSDGPDLLLQRTGYENRQVSDSIRSNRSAGRVWIWKTIDAHWNGRRVQFYPLNARDDLIQSQGGDPY